MALIQELNCANIVESERWHCSLLCHSHYDTNLCSYFHHPDNFIPFIGCAGDALDRHPVSQPLDVDGLMVFNVSGGIILFTMQYLTTI